MYSFSHAPFSEVEEHGLHSFVTPSFCIFWSCLRHMNARRHQGIRYRDSLIHTDRRADLFAPFSCIAYIHIVSGTFFGFLILLPSSFSSNRCCVRCMDLSYLVVSESIDGNSVHLFNFPLTFVLIVPNYIWWVPLISPLFYRFLPWFHLLSWPVGLWTKKLKEPRTLRRKIEKKLTQAFQG